MTVSVLEASIRVPSTAESNIDNVITEIGFPVTTHSSINNVVHVSEFDASLPVLPTTQAPINNAVTVGELEAAPDFFTATHSMDKNVTIGVISFSPNIFFEANLFAFIISSFYFTIWGQDVFKYSNVGYIKSIFAYKKNYKLNLKGEDGMMEPLLIRGIILLTELTDNIENTIDVDSNESDTDASCTDNLSDQRDSATDSD